MGNLLGSPVTEKHTHVGATSDGIQYGVSSMQGWRVHMEDAYIAEGRLYAFLEGKKVELPGHALFAVFDGHGGTFAAAYAGRNLCRVLSKQAKFAAYAAFELERPQKEKTFTKSSERAHYIQAGLMLLEHALCDAFVEIDREIACALKGQKVSDADQPYHDESEEGHGSEKGDSEARGKNSENPEGMDTEETSPADDALKLLQDEGDSGTTACVVLLTPEWVVCANAGDSRAVMSKVGHRVVPLSYDHKPEDGGEANRIRLAGGYVAGGRVEGDLAVSRGLGDFRFKNMEVVMQATKWEDRKIRPEVNDEQVQSRQQVLNPEDQKVSPIPDIIVQNRNPSQDEFIIIACDGIWDVQTNYEGVKTVAELFQEGESNVGLVCEEVCDICLRMGSKDNMTALVIKLDAQKVGDGGGVLARRQQRDAEARGDDDGNEDT